MTYSVTTKAYSVTWQMPRQIDDAPTRRREVYATLGEARRKRNAIDMELGDGTAHVAVTKAERG